MPSRPVLSESSVSPQPYSKSLTWGLALSVVLGYGYFALAYINTSSPCETESSNDLLWYASFLARTFDFHAGLGLLVIAFLGACFRRYTIAAATLPICVVALLPTVRSNCRVHANASISSNFKVMTINLLWVNRNTTPIIDEIQTEKPDLLLLQEYTPTWHAAMQRTLTTMLPYYFGYPVEEAFGTAIYSKYPLSDAYRFPGSQPGDRSPIFRSTLHVLNREIAVYCVHIVPPSWFNRVLMRRQFCDLYDVLAHEQRPMLIGGDFNFTSNAIMNRQIRSLGLSEAHEQSGHGRGSTFKIPWLPDIAIDHVYLTRELIPVQCRTGIGRGSDHRPVIVDLQID